jgi:thymidylate synthase
MHTYLKLLSDVITLGEKRKDRTGVGTIGLFGYQWRHNLADGFPLLTTKKVHFKSVLVELLWILRGKTNIDFLKEHGVSIWDEWADKDGDLGPVYGKQWVRWSAEGAPDINQVENLVAGLKTSPHSRRHIVSAWNPADVGQMALPPCHTLWQCHVGGERKLNLHLYARSIDSFLGLPFNIASYALLNMLLARHCGLLPGELIISFGDLHIYLNHIEQVREQLSRKPTGLPAVLLLHKASTPLNEIEPEAVHLIGYKHQPAIKAPVAV